MPMQSVMATASAKHDVAVPAVGRSALIWGDTVHFPHIQIARPDVSIAFDQDPQRAPCVTQGGATRCLLRMVVSL